ncbi:hypothetical protein [Planococcus sp. 4-30]|uniref:hypothetical protein n=1 Tax=Planococcus sp. 4-30 TaxID=2874583 RepID=UPI001CBDCF52|nr:hypothetical protein [Planococcus sp. 4-30]
MVFGFKLPVERENDFMGGQMDLWAVGRDLWTLKKIYGRAAGFMGVQLFLHKISCKKPRNLRGSILTIL